MYTIKNFTIDYKEQVYHLYCDFQKEKDFFKKLSFDEFSHILFSNNFQEEGSFICENEQGKLIGFASARARKIDDNNPNASGYIHTFIVDKNYRRQGIGSALLNKIEEFVKNANRLSIRFVFLGQINWPWYIPHTDHHLHPGMPCVQINSDFYLFLYHHHYVVNSIHEGFHLPLKEYKMPQAVLDRMTENAKSGLTVELYDPNKHYGIDEFCNAIDNEGFANSIKNNLKKENPYPFLVASSNGKVVGWTGAIYVESTGRGHLDGICVHPDYRKFGLGKALFCNLCDQLQKMGASYMTFFTGLDNPARFIYLFAGFNVVQSFADMKKVL